MTVPATGVNFKTFQHDESFNMITSKIYWFVNRQSAAEPKCEEAVKEEPKKEEPKAAPAPKKEAPKKKDDDDDGFDMSSDSEDDEETLAIIAKKNAEKEAKNKGKPKVVDKSSIILSVKPLEAETDMEEVAKRIKAEVVPEGLKWMDHKLVPVAFGVKKLTIICVIEDDKVSLDDITEAIEAMDDVVQSVDVDAFNKM